MATNKKISQLPNKDEPLPTDIVPIVDTGVTPISTKQTTLANIIATFRGVPSGVASLDSNGKIPVLQLPGLAINDTFVVSSEAAMLAAAAEVGDVVVRTDISKSFILADEPASALGNWVELLASGIPSTPGNNLDGGSF